MSERLLDRLEAAFGARGVDCERDGALLRIADGLVVEPRVLPRGENQVQVDFAIDAPRLAGIPLLDSHAGVGATVDAAADSAFENFLRGSFDVVLETLTGHGGGSDDVDWQDWRGAAHAWRVCAGPLLGVATRGGARIEGFPEFLPRLEELFAGTMRAGTHWLRVFLGAVDGGHRISEVLVDGALWEEGQQALEAHEWRYPEGYASLRLLAIALPAA